MHAASLAKSERLQRVARYLRKTRHATTMEIIEHARVCAVSSIIAELRCNGWEIDCARRGDVWTYTVRAAK